MTATTATIPAPSVTRGHHPAIWSRLALMLAGAALGVTATVIIADDNDSPASTGSADAQFRDASAAEAGRYVDSLESVSAAVPVGVQPSINAVEHSSVAPVEVQPSINAVEHTALVEAGTYAHGYDYSSEPGVCTRVTREPC